MLWCKLKPLTKPVIGFEAPKPNSNEEWIKTTRSPFKWPSWHYSLIPAPSRLNTADDDNDDDDDPKDIIHPFIHWNWDLQLAKIQIKVSKVPRKDRNVSLLHGKDRAMSLSTIPLMAPMAKPQKPGFVAEQLVPRRKELRHNTGGPEEAARPNGFRSFCNFPWESLAECHVSGRLLVVKGFRIKTVGAATVYSHWGKMASRHQGVIDRRG